MPVLGGRRSVEAVPDAAPGEHPRGPTEHRTDFDKVKAGLCCARFSQDKPLAPCWLACQEVIGDETMPPRTNIYKNERSQAGCVGMRRVAIGRGRTRNVSTLTWIRGQLGFNARIHTPCYLLQAWFAASAGKTIRGSHAALTLHNSCAWQEV